MSHGWANGRRHRLHSAYLAGVALAGLLAGGCAKPNPTPYPTWFTPPPAYVPATTSDNAFDGYARAAIQTERLLPDDLNRVGFTPGQQKRVLERIGEPMKTLEAASKLPCTVPDRAFLPGVAPTYQRGWRLLGRALAWRIERDLVEQKVEDAIHHFLVATKFGFDLTGGEATDAALGLQIADEARGALAPSLPTLTPVDLTRIIVGVTEILKARPRLEVALRNERGNMQAAVQFVQDSYQANDFAALRDLLGPDAREPIRFLEDLRERDGKNRADFFEGFGKEIDEEIELLVERAKLPAAARGPIPLPPAEGRPWKRLARHFFRSARPLIDLDDRAVARTRLLVLSAQIMRTIKETGTAPKSLASLPQDLIVDPYSGRPFRYTAVGAETKLYSIGADLRDDGGETDELGLTPDLVLEGAQD